MSVRSRYRLYASAIALSLIGGAPVSAQQAATPAPAPAQAQAQVQAKPATPAPVAQKPAPGPAAAAQIATAPVAPVRMPVAEVTSQIQKAYEHTANLKARFNQTLTGAMGKRQASGVLLIKKPGKMRWDYEKPEKKLFVADGTMLWMYEPEDEQAFRQPLSGSQLPAQVSFLFGRGKLSDEFDVTYFEPEKLVPPVKLGEASDLFLKLVPKKPTTQYKHLVFVVNPKTFMVKETLLFDQQGGTNHLVFSNIEVNLKSGIDDSRFSFTPPAGTKIINPNNR